MRKTEDVGQIVKDFPVICVTGKMAAGKNYISSQLEKEGWNSIDADLLVHKAIEQSKDVIFETFQSYQQECNVSIKNPDGSINRRNLGVILFKYPELMKKQEDIVYPVITKMVEDFIETHNKTIINATVLFKTPALLNKCSAIIFVDANIIKRFIRARKRDNLPVKQILKRFYTQRNLLKDYKTSGKPIHIIKN